MEMVTDAVFNKVEIERKKVLEEERRRLVLENNTREWCEIVGNTFEKQVKEGKIPSYSFVFDCGYEMMLTTKEYVDKRCSYKAIGKQLDLTFIKKWFEQYCFKVTVERIHIWRYGLGYNPAFNVTIEPNPKCLK